jgi:hypothetical protein
VESSQHHGAVSEVCRLHTEVVGAPAPSGDAGRPGDPVAAGGPPARANSTDAARTFGGTRHDPRIARAFVLEMLRPWRDEQLAADAALVVTELDTNAVLHARSAFSVRLLLAEDVIRISVEDTLPLGQPGGNRWLPAEPGHGHRRRLPRSTRPGSPAPLWVRRLTVSALASRARRIRRQG